MKFTKMNGLGNDYIFINSDKENIKNPHTLSVKLCNQHRFIGGDGIVLIGSCDEADLYMRIFNADGSEGLMCGNALRCVGKYAYENLGIKKDKYTVKTASGLKTVDVKVKDDKVVCATADLGQISGFTGTKSIKLGSVNYEGYFASVGNPHIVFFVDEFPSDLHVLGKQISESDINEGGVNVEFVLKHIKDDIITVRVYERGSGETMACGTGAAASFYVSRNLKYVGDRATVMLPGGNITCFYNGTSYKITGTVEKNFEGEIEL